MFFTKLKEFLFGKPQILPVLQKTEEVNSVETPVIQLSVVVDKPTEPEPIKNPTTTAEVDTKEEGHVDNMPETAVVQTPAVITKSSSSNKSSDKKSNKANTKPKTTRKPKSNTKTNQ